MINLAFGRRVGKGMIRISIAFFYDLGDTLQPLSSLSAGDKLSERFVGLFAAHNALDDFFGAEWFWPAIKSSYAPGQRLVEAIKAITSLTDFNHAINHFEAFNVTSALSKFKTVIGEELGVVDAYFVSQKAGYSTSTLIANAEANFPTDLPIKVSSAVPDIREAGRCLAFELPTASGFHVLRATEAVLRKYWDSVTNGAPHPRNRNMGVYIDKLEKLGVGNPKVIAVLKQIKDLHRNPLMHPEETLGLQEAIGLFGIAHSAMGAMLKEIQTPVPEPANALALAAAYAAASRQPS